MERHRETTQASSVSSPGCSENTRPYSNGTFFIGILSEARPARGKELFREAQTPLGEASAEQFADNWFLPQQAGLLETPEVCGEATVYSLAQSEASDTASCASLVASARFPAPFKSRTIRRVGE